jgi:hypothetical protein
LTANPQGSDEQPFEDCRTRRIDQSLLRFDNIWAAAGTPNAVFRLTPADLVALTGGLVVSVANG